MTKARWLITGADGQLGAALLSEEPPAGVEWIGRGRAALDLSDSAQVAAAIDELRPQVVINAAAFTQVDACESERARAHAVNADGPGALAACCAGRALLVHVSTEFVFDGTQSVPIPEDAPIRPRNVYGETKAAGEAAVRESGCDHLIVRTQWLFGQGRNFVRTILETARRGQPLRVVEDQLGRPTSTSALAQGIRVAIDGGLRGTVHIACEGIASWYDFARQIVAQGAQRGLCQSVSVDPVATSAFPRPATRPAYGVLALERARAHGIRSPHWMQALEAYLDEEAKRHA